MDKKLLQSLSTLISKMPKKDLEKNLEKAKGILKNSKKEDLKKILSNPQISKMLGKDAKELENKIENIDLTNLDLNDIENKLK